MKYLLGLCAFFLIIIAYLFYQGYTSKKGNPAGLVDGSLVPCPNDKPNCAIRMVEFEGIHSDSWQSLKKSIIKTGGLIISDKKDYLSATYTSSFFGFVDDVEVYSNPNSTQFHLRSASRVGYSDMGANTKRLDQIVAEWKQ